MEISHISNTSANGSKEVYSLKIRDRITCCLDLCKNLRKENKYFCRRHKCRVKDCNLQGIGIYRKCYGHLLFLSET